MTLREVGCSKEKGSFSEWDARGSGVVWSGLRRRSISRGVLLLPRLVDGGEVFLL